MIKKRQDSECAQRPPSILKKTLESYAPNIARIFLPWICRHPRYLRGFLRLRRTHLQAKKRREEELAKGVKVPPFLILSITPHCNLQCTGCYAAATGTALKINCTKPIQQSKLLSYDQWHTIIKEANTLGVFGYVFAGGEPFLFPKLLQLCKEFNDRFFLILTNGTTLKQEDYQKLKRLGNIAILVSIEGDADFTNKRRGQNVYEQAMTTLQKLKKIGVICGVSVTITRNNYAFWMNPDHIDHLISQGIRIGTFIEYIPLTPAHTTGDSDHDLLLTPEERKLFRSQMLSYRDSKSIYIVHSPGDEEFFGGCVSAGRGFAHITSTGDLTPCPISNIATHNLTTSTLREGLASPLFSEIRANEHLLETEGMPCALFAHPKEVDELAESVGAYKTSIE